MADREKVVTERSKVSPEEMPWTEVEADAPPSGDCVPEHVLIIMDGNHRWAKRNNLSGFAGHRAGANNLKDISQACLDLGIRHLTVFAFSTENWHRPLPEVRLLMDLIRHFVRVETRTLKENGIKLRVIGDRSRLPEDIQKTMAESERETAANDALHLTIAVNFGGRWDIVETAKSLAQKVRSGELAVEDIDEKTFQSQMSLGELPAPDLLIRTGGEYRVSNFMLWDLAYTEMYFTEAFWPDFDKANLTSAVDDFARRSRRYGRRG